jgi:hypothetical protein
MTTTCLFSQVSLVSSSNGNTYVLNGGFEEPLIYDPWTIPSWGDGGSLGVGLPSYVGSAVRLYQWSTEHGSEIAQEINFDKEQLVLLFWLKPLPENNEIIFKVLFDGYVIFNHTYTGANEQYDWVNIQIMLEPIFSTYELTTGVHEIRFHISEGIGSIPDPMPSVAIDEVSILSAEEVNQNPTLSLEPTATELPWLEQEPLAIYLELTIQNVSSLKRYSFEFNYNRTVLEFIGSKMDDYFYTTTGGWIGNGFQGNLSRSFTGSATMFVYAFKILNIGITHVDIVNASLWTDNGLSISHNVTTCTITIKSLEEWIDGEYAVLDSEYEDYRNSHSYIDLEFTDISNERNQWISEYNSLNTTYTQYSESHSHSDTEYNSLLSENQSLRTSQNLNYILIIISVILAATTFYFALVKKKT